MMWKKKEDRRLTVIPKVSPALESFLLAGPHLDDHSGEG